MATIANPALSPVSRPHATPTRTYMNTPQQCPDRKSVVDFYGTIGTRMQAWWNEMEDLRAASVTKPLTGKRQKRYWDLARALDIYVGTLDDYETYNPDLPQFPEIARALKAA
jgi:hypothetical protein